MCSRETAAPWRLLHRSGGGTLGRDAATGYKAVWQSLALCCWRCWPGSWRGLWQARGVVLRPGGLLGAAGRASEAAGARATRRPVGTLFRARPPARRSAL